MNEIKQIIFYLDDKRNYYGHCPICSEYITLTHLHNIDINTNSNININIENKFQTTKFICSHFKDVIIGQMGNVIGVFRESR